LKVIHSFPVLRQGKQVLTRPTVIAS
jgi:hypothetical protein